MPSSTCCVALQVVDSAADTPKGKVALVRVERVRVAPDCPHPSTIRYDPPILIVPDLG